MAHLVYTSTYNVVFGGQVIRNGNESLPYLPLYKVHCNPHAVVVLNYLLIYSFNFFHCSF